MKTLFDDQEYSTVSQLTGQIKNLLEGGFTKVWVVGEISSLTRAGSGHIYLSLKDKDACLRCVVWRSTALQLRFTCDEGMEVLARGRISVYPPRGDYQLVIEDLQPKGIGAAEIALKKLKEKLAKLGYFAPERKRPLPKFPRRLALVTSAAGAAVRDMLEILARRWPSVEVLICPVRVQGTSAAIEIAYKLGNLNAFQDIEVILLGRGGGSAQDLAAFNEEVVATAIFKSRIPVISAVGHEIDVTIADLVADRRALTPSEAAEIATPDRRILLKNVNELRQRLNDQLANRLRAGKQRLDDLGGRRVFRQPMEKLRERERRLDELDQRLRRSVSQRLMLARQAMEKGAAQLESLSPLNVLSRGYSLTRSLPTRELIRGAEQVAPQDRVEIRLHRGSLVARVEEIQSPLEPHHA